METGVLIDTDVLIELQKERPAAETWFASLSIMPGVAGFSAMELIAGCGDGHELRKAERFLLPFPVFWPSEAAMLRALLDFGPLHLSHGIGLPDMLIAATAMEHGLALATFNGRHFRAVAGLTVVQPYTR